MDTPPNFFEGFTGSEPKSIVDAYKQCADNFFQGNRTEAYRHMAVILDHYRSIQTPMPTAMTRIYMSTLATDASEHKGLHISVAEVHFKTPEGTLQIWVVPEHRAQTGTAVTGHFHGRPIFENNGTEIIRATEAIDNNPEKTIFQGSNFTLA